MKHIKIEHLPFTRGFETEYGVRIHCALQSGMTRLFDNKEDAEEDAKIRRRYVYPVFEDKKTSGYYAVPN